MTSCDASVLGVGKSFNLVLTLLFVTLVREIYHPDHPDHPDHHADHFGHLDQPNQSGQKNCREDELIIICSHHHYLLVDRRITSWPNNEFNVYSAVCQHQTILYWPPAKYKAKIPKFLGLFPFGLDYFQFFRPPQPPSLEDEILRHLGPWERDQVKSTRAARQDTDGTNMTNRVVVNAGTGLLHNLAGSMLMLLLRALFSLFSRMHLG